MNTTKQYAYGHAAKLVNYNRKTGVFIWLKREGNDSKTRQFNARFSGKECGCDDGKGYSSIKIRIDGKLFTLAAHRLAWLIVNGEMPDYDIDHIDGNRSNNKIDNLRAVTKALNCRNAKMLKSNTSGVTGVTLDKSTGKWRARARVDRKMHSIGCFDDIEAAEAAVKSFRSANGFTARHGQE